MPCRYRRRHAAGTYYALRRAEPPHLIFAEARDYEDLEIFLTQALERTGTNLLGYCWMPDAIHLALSVSVTPLTQVIRRITWYCSQRIRTRTGTKARYMDSLPMRLLEPETHLPMLLRYIHRIPVMAGAANSPADYPYTSRRTYAVDLRAAYNRNPGPNACSAAPVGAQHIRNPGFECTV